MRWDDYGDDPQRRNLDSHGRALRNIHLYSDPLLITWLGGVIDWLRLNGADSRPDPGLTLDPAVHEVSS